MTNHTDVLIVGAGPAGSAAANALKQSGLSVTLVEKKKLPRYKMCSGIIFPSSRAFIEKHVGDIPNHMLCHPKKIKGNRVFLNNETPVLDTPFSLFDEGNELPDEGFNIWRSDFDQWLAEQSNATLIDQCRFIGFKRQDGQYRIDLVKKGEPYPITAKYLIAADGTLSRVRRTAFPGFDDHVNLIPIYEEIYDADIDLEPGWLYIFLDRLLSNYFATVFHKDDKVIIDTGAHQDESVKSYYNRFINHLKRHHGLNIKKKIGSHGIQLTDMSARKNYCLGCENILLAGEAGGFLRGGEGITSALISGHMAGLSVFESMTTGNPAITHFQELSAEELKTCEKVHETLAGIIGYNVFIRT